MRGMYLYLGGVCVCVCAHVNVCEREGEKRRKREREGGSLFDSENLDGMLKFGPWYWK